MTAPNPVDHEELFNSIFLGGQQSPGTVTLSGHDREAKWDVKTVKGKKGANITLDTIQPTKFQASFYLVTRDQWDDWESFQDLIESTFNGTTVRALDIYHPDLARNGIKSVCGAKIGGKKHDGKGGQNVTIEFLEYFPPIEGGGTPTKSEELPRPLRPGENGPEVDPDAAALAQLGALRAKSEATPWG
jgi:hypothetical protein